MTKRLKWGQSPISRMTRKELEVCAERMYCALVQAYSCLQIHSFKDFSGYWSTNGPGGNALDMCEQALLFTRAYRSGSPYCYFYRYAHDLLFDGTKCQHGFNWHVCDKCGKMVGPMGNSTPECFECKTKMRKITWKDLGRDYGEVDK